MSLQAALSRLKPGLTQSQTIRQFHRMYYDSHVWRNTFWFGVETQKCPLDLWIYQEILHAQRPDVVVETGTWSGGSAFYLASIFDLIGRGRVVTVDIEVRPERPQHPRIKYVEGHSSTANEALAEVQSAIQGSDRVMVILDSDHSEKHVLDELRAYWNMVTPGEYLIVEDTNINGHPVLPDFGPGAMEALDVFLRENDSFEIDDTKEKFFMTFNPRGYLKRRKD